MIELILLNALTIFVTLIVFMAPIGTMGHSFYRVPMLVICLVVAIGSAYEYKRGL